ncbi:hypothetical protein ACVWY2_000123 [Bradyrhizobium sp. JR6.1]
MRLAPRVRPMICSRTSPITRLRKIELAQMMEAMPMTRA